MASMETMMKMIEIATRTSGRTCTT